MQIEVKIDENCQEPKIIVVTDKMTDEINTIIKKLSDEQPQIIAGFKDDTVEVLEPSDIYRIFATSGKVPVSYTHLDVYKRQLLMRWHVCHLIHSLKMIMWQ